MRRVRLCAVLLATSVAAWAGPGRGEESAPLVLNVTPSGIEDGAQARLVRRARDLDFAFRSICIGCGTRAIERPERGHLFSPLEVLPVSR